MIAALALLLLAAQEPTQPPQAGDIKPSPWREMPGTPDEQQGQPRRDPRVTLYFFQKCVAERSTERATKTLAGDFTKPEYSASMKLLAKVNESCLRARRSTLKADGLLAGGALAEALIKADPALINVRLARAATKPAPATYSPTDQAAMCVVRSVPDDVAKLFATKIASAEEKAAADALQPIMAQCLQGRRAEITTEGLRAMLATAAFRSIYAVAAK